MTVAGCWRRPVGVRRPLGPAVSYTSGAIVAERCVEVCVFASALPFLTRRLVVVVLFVWRCTCWCVSARPACADGAVHVASVS